MLAARQLERVGAAMSATGTRYAKLTDYSVHTEASLNRPRKLFCCRQVYYV
jgi:hypothetical protein